MNAAKSALTLPPEDGISTRQIPFKNACVEIVIIMAGIRNLTTPRPLTRPVSMPTPIASASEPASPSAPFVLNIAMAMVPKEITLDTDISMPPMSSTLHCAIETMASTAVCATMLR